MLQILLKATFMHAKRNQVAATTTTSENAVSTTWTELYVELILYCMQSANVAFLKVLRNLLGVVVFAAICYRSGRHVYLDHVLNIVLSAYFIFIISRCPSD